MHSIPALFTRRPLLLLLMSLLLSCSLARASQTISLPVTIPFSLLETLVSNHAFPEQGQQITLIDKANQCIYLAASNPHISEENGTIRLEMQVLAHMGTPLAGNCYTPLDWQGFLVLYQQPTIIPGTWTLSFTTVKSELYGPDHEPVAVINLLWDFIESYTTTYFTESTIDLMPPVDSLKQFLLPLFPVDIQQNTLEMLESMQPGSVSVQSDALHFSILADVEDVYLHEHEVQAKKRDPESLARVVALWENWDALLSYLVVTLSKQVLANDERQLLMDTLLETRYRFVDELSEKTLTQDFVRQQFVAAWRALAPLFKNHLLQQTEASEALGYLAFVSASDALVVFDRLGPTFGLEISREGLIRLIEMLHENPAVLDYRSELDPELQRLFTPDGQNSDANDPVKSTPLPSPESRGEAPAHVLGQVLLNVNIFSARSALAADVPTFKEILKWKIPKDNITDYIARIRQLLTKESTQLLDKGTIPQSLQPMFRRMIVAMAWQESCFRQFIVENKQLTYLLSYNQSSVGLMQINERVWRGIYNKELLRWDISYNARAGCEIAALYLKKYALKDHKRAKTLTDETMARLVYALYNGGPAQYTAFFKRLKNKKFYKSDELFKQKFTWVTSDKIDQVANCLLGG